MVARKQKTFIPYDELAVLKITRLNVRYRFREIVIILETKDSKALFFKRLEAQPLCLTDYNELSQHLSQKLRNISPLTKQRADFTEK